MDKKVLVEATLSENFRFAWNNDYANQMYDHVLSTFRKNGTGEYSRFVSDDKKTEKFVFPQKNDGMIMLEMKRDTIRDGIFKLYASMDEKSSHIFFDAWEKRMLGSLNPAISNEDHGWDNKIKIYDTVERGSVAEQSFNKNFDLSKEKGVVCTESYMREIQNAEFVMYPRVAVEKDKDVKFGYDCYKATMFGKYKNQDIMLEGGTFWKMRFDDGDMYPDEYNKRPILFVKVGDTYVENASLTEQFRNEMRNVYRYNGHSEDALGNKPPNELIDYSIACVRYGMDKETFWYKDLPMPPIDNAKDLEKEFANWKEKTAGKTGRNSVVKANLKAKRFLIVENTETLQK